MKKTTYNFNNIFLKNSQNSIDSQKSKNARKSNEDESLGNWMGKQLEKFPAKDLFQRPFTLSPQCTYNLLKSLPNFPNKIDALNLVLGVRIYGPVSITYPAIGSSINLDPYHEILPRQLNS